MDKKKILSSLAAAGILTASVLGANVNAATNLKSVGVYKQLVEGKTVVPYILEDGNTPLTVRDVENEFENLQLVNGTAVTDKSASLKTGDTFKANNTEYTIVVLGDVNGSGTVTTADALKIQDMSFDAGNNAVIKVAADTTADGTIKTSDALRLQDYLLGDAEISVPEAEEPEVVSNYTVTVNENGYITGSNLKTTVLKIKLAETSDENTVLKVRVTGINESTGEELVMNIKNSITINAHTDYREAKLTSVDFSKFKDGMVKIELLEDGKVVASVDAEKNVLIPAATSVITNRISTKEATLSLEALGESDIAKVYYIVDGKDVSKVDTDFFDTDGKLKDGVKVLEVSDNKLSNEVIASDLTTKTPAKVSFILENKYGSRSAVASALIASDSENVAQPKKVEEVKVPEKLDKNTTAEFSWEGEKSVNYVAVLYRDGIAVAEKTVNYVDSTDFTVDFASEMDEAGAYKVAVYAPATDTSKASEVTESAEVNVAKLEAVTDLSFRNEDNKVILSWNNANDKESFKEYKIELYTLDKEGKETSKKSIASPATDKNEVEISSVKDNTVYLAKVTVIAKDGQLATVDSDETVSAKFFKVGVPTVNADGLTENTITLNVPEIIINGETAKYKVNVYSVNEEATLEEALYTRIDTRDVTVEDGKVTIDGLDSNTPYAFKLIAVVDGEEVESDYSLPIYTIPELKNLTVVEKADEADEEGKVFVNSGKLTINKEEIDPADYNNSKKLTNAINIIANLKAGDIVSIEDQKVTLKLDNGASADTTGRDFTSLTGLKDTVFEIESNKYNKNISFNDSEEVKEVILKGEDTMFTISGDNIKKLTLTNGVEVSGDREYTVAENSTVVINGVSVTTEKETVIEKTKNTYSKDVLLVNVNKEANDLVFENKKDSEITITFKGEDDNTSTQSGSIIIKNNGGKVTVTSDKANVSSELKVEVNSGDVDISEPSLTGDKNVTVSVDEGKTSTVTISAKTKAPIELNNVSVDITDEDLRDVSGVTDKNFDDVKAFLQSFDLSGTGATVSVEKDSNKVTITFTPEKDKTIDNVEIGNLK